MTADPSPEPRSIQELYFEAINASAGNPENNVTPYGASPYGAPPEDWIHAPPNTEFHPPSVPPAAPAQPPRDGDPFVQPLRPVGWNTRDERSQVVQAAGTGFAGSALVSDIFQETDVRQAIQSLATQAGIKVVLDDAVGGYTSAIIEDEPFEAALDQILLPLGLVSKRVGDVQYLIGTDDPESSMFPHIAENAEYRPAHRPPQELLELLAPRMQRFVRVVDGSNLMIVEAPAESLETILVQLQQFDRPVPQVILEAIVCVLSPENGVEHGLDLGHALTVGDQQLLNLGLTNLVFGGSFTPWGVRNWYNDFAVTSVFVRMLAEEGYVTIRAAPRVMAKDGEQAEISIGRETYFSTQPLASDLIFRTDIERVEAGIELNITPTIRGDNITVTIEKAEVSENIRNELFDRERNPYPLINRRRVSTTVDVKDGETIVIGGLQTRQTVDRVGRIPYLGDLPLCGKLFRMVESEEQEVEVVIFISPRLVHSQQDSAVIRRPPPPYAPQMSPPPPGDQPPPPRPVPGPELTFPTESPSPTPARLPRIEPRAARQDGEPTRLPPPRLLVNEKDLS